MYNVIGVRFKKAGKIYYFDPGEFTIEKDDYVIVETARGIEYGKVVVPVKTVGENDVVLPLKQVVRVASERDRQQVEDNRQEAQQAFETGTGKIEEHRLDMKLVDVEYTFDRNKVIFYFTAEGRVDFRNLVKDLASIFRTRIELRQIGVRDEAKMLGGIGPCGRMLCCSTFLGDFEPVSIKMAKDQNLSLNPSKISGLCGRLMCCLKYENDEYEQAKKEMPDVGSRVSTPDGDGRVVGMNILERVLKIRLSEQDQTLEYALSEIMDQGTRA
ncbi:PSP1 domain-containing protein [Metaplanococcus flavidus]|uniref:Stage 0 sporulation family protein n=1 Tax=Metaplanococcus flavidus TaxID=569883 RepID=A0ABW3LHE8_9BACL